MSRRSVCFQLFAFAVCICFSADCVIAETIVFDLRAPFMGMNDGNILEETGTHSEGGITLTATAENGVVNGTASGMGVNADVVGDATGEIEAAFNESLSFTLGFSGFTVELVSIDLAGVGPSDPHEADAAIISINGTEAIRLFTGVAGFNGSSDIWTPVETVNLLSGDVFTFTATDSYRIEEITVETSVVSGTDNADFNSDSIVDGDDFLVWQLGFGSGTTPAQGDANGSSSVDSADLVVWQAQYGTSPATLVTAPEPTCVGLAVAAVIASLAVRSSRREG
ncbi:MAG: hypothetical protein RH917_12470 [Lacipirellulaceae bacterium]